MLFWWKKWVSRVFFLFSPSKWWVIKTQMLNDDDQNMTWFLLTEIYQICSTTPTNPYVFYRYGSPVESLGPCLELWLSEAGSRGLSPLTCCSPLLGLLLCWVRPSAGLCIYACSMEGEGRQVGAQLRAWSMCSKLHSILHSPKRPHSPNHGLQFWFMFLLKYAIDNLLLFWPQSPKKCTKQKITYLQSTGALSDEDKQ